MKRLIASLFLFLPLLARAQEPVRLSLADAVTYAINHADTIKNSRLTVLQQQERNDQIKSNALPRINGNIAFTDFLYKQTSFIPGEIAGQPGTYIPVQFTPTYSGTAGVTGSQVLFDGTLLVALQARKAVMEFVNAASKLSEEGLKYGVQRAYFSIVVAQRQHRILGASLATARQMLYELDATYKAGFIEKIDVTRATVQVNNLESDSIRTASLLEGGEQLLKYSIGMPINQPIVLTDTAISGKISEAAGMLTTQLEYTTRTEYNLLQKQRQLNEYSLKRYKLAAYPTLAVAANVGYNYSTNDFSEIVRLGRNYLFSSYVGLQLNMPIFNGFLRQHQMAEARLEIQRTDNNIHQLQLGIDLQYAQSRTVLRNAVIGLQKQERNLELSNTVLDLARKKFKAGVGSSVEMSLAQTDLLLSQNNYFTALLDLINAETDVQRSIGGFR